MNRKRAQLRKDPEFASVTRPVTVERIRLAWWQPEQSGWSFDAIKRSRWQGRHSGETYTSLNWDADLARLDRTQFRRKCRRFKVDAADWCVLVSIARNAEYLREVNRRSVHTAANVFGLRSAKVRIGEAIQRCSMNGLIVPLDSNEDSRIEAAVRASVSPLATRNQDPNIFELSESGAALLVELGPKILGDAWLDGWLAEREVFSLADCYAPNLLDVASVFEKYHDRPDLNVTVISLEEIGPWCLHWWKRFPKGYRVKLAIVNKYA